VDIHAGYEVIRVRIDNNEIFLDSGFTGPCGGLTVSF